MNRQQSKTELESRIRQSERRHMCLVASDRPEGKRLARAAEVGKLMQPMPRLFARPEYWEILDPVERVLHCMRSLQLLHPAWTYVGPSAGLVYGLEIPDDESYLWPIRIAARWGSRGRSTPQLLRQVVEGDDVVVVDHLRVTSIERTAFDCMREMSFADGLAVMDSALAASGLTRNQMIIRMNQFRRTSRGGRHAMEAANYGDGAARGYGESCLRAALIEAGFEIPQLHVDVTTSEGTDIHGTFGWIMDDGSWIVARLASPRYAEAQPEDDDNVCILTIPRTMVHDGEAFTALLEEAGVPHAAEPPRVGIAKAFKPVHRGLDDAEDEDE